MKSSAYQFLYVKICQEQTCVPRVVYIYIYIYLYVYIYIYIYTDNLRYPSMCLTIARKEGRKKKLSKKIGNFRTNDY